MRTNRTTKPPSEPPLGNWRAIRTTLSALLLVVMLMAALPALRVAAGTVTVNSLSDLTFGGCTVAIPTCTLPDAIAAAAPGDTINFGLSGTIPLISPLPTISKNLTISGAGQSIIVDGGHAFRAFLVTTGTVVLDSMTIQNGQVSDGGGGVLETGGTVTVSNCVVTGNTVIGAGNPAGGGIYAAGGDLTVVNSTISNNTVTGTDTGTASIFVSGGGVENDFGTLTVTNSTISNNTVRMTGTNTNANIEGGGVFVQITFHMTGSTVSGNQLISSVGTVIGGGILAYPDTTTVTNSTIAKNKTTGAGGGLYTGGTVSITSTTITGNTANGGGGGVTGNALITDTLIAGNSGGGTPDVSFTASGTSTNNLIGDGSGLGGISNGANGNQIGTSGAPIDARLDPSGLHANGSTGPLTVALLRNSPAIEAGGTCPSGVFTDERGQVRVGNCDIGAYEYQPIAPTLNNATAPANGGSVTFSGSGFQTGSHLTIGSSVLIAPGNAVSINGTQMTLTVPAHSVGAVPMAVNNPGNATVAVATLTYLPVVTSVGPSSGITTGGVTVTISGAGFGTDPTQLSAKFGTVNASVQTVSDTQLVVTTPAGNGTVDVTVTVNGQSGALHGAYTYGTVNPLPPPKPSVAPASGANPLPVARPAGVSTGGNPPAPLPPRRP